MIEIEEKKEKTALEQYNEMQKKSKGQGRPSRTISVIALTLAIFSIFLALIFDFIAFKDTILMFIAIIVVGSVAFVFLFMLFLMSFILIFGFYLVEQYGFWPLSLTIQFFKEMFGDLTITAEQMQMFISFRIALICICVVLLGLSITARVMVEKDIKAGFVRRIDSTPGCAKAALALSIMGLLISLGAMAIGSALV